MPKHFQKNNKGIQAFLKSEAAVEMLRGVAEEIVAEVADGFEEYQAGAGWKIGMDIRKQKQRTVVVVKSTLPGANFIEAEKGYFQRAINKPRGERSV